MVKNPIQRRRERYFKLSSQIAQIDDARLRSMFEESETSGGWGKNHTLEIGGSKVFVKRVPVTDLEVENMFSTRNYYELPIYYNYGVGSAGFGVFRELVAHVKTTNWVLEGATAFFPLTYHYRFMPFSGKRGEVDMERHRRYVEYWGGDSHISRYILDRASANYELALFLEHMPYTLEPWLVEHPDQVARILGDLRDAITFLRKNGIIHFDAHFWNIVTEGERAYLTDFGLVLDRSFALTKEELAFFRRNSHYDYGEVLACLGFLLKRAYDGLSEADQRGLVQKLGLAEGSSHDELLPALLDNIEAIHQSGALRLAPSFAGVIVQYRRIIALMEAFYSDMQKNHKKNTKLRHAELVRLLKETGFIPVLESGGACHPV